MSDDEFEEKDVKPRPKAKTTKKDKYGAFVLLIDCGSSMQETREGKSHFSLAKEAADWILSRKASGIIFTKAKDRVSIILFGCEETKNSLDIDGVFLQDEVLSPVGFDQLRFLNHEVNHNLKRVGNAVDALLVATDFLHQQTDGDPAVLSKNILVFTNGLSDADHRKSEVSALVNGINAMEATLVAMYA
ncbi:Ku70/Ku80 alpha/beta domain protein [Oesophagostomum dentatum]|uniref:Ku70/Ku80 alpha/beta domain protein n=1 Tax=Oesophagostomum dentatum TaxID=61180 RepID=A0A0B1TCS7_OESDE|nr:Ku70/Ku80 alpha/beta domain protein [Oesophagostomum dentatum]